MIKNNRANLNNLQDKVYMNDDIYYVSRMKILNKDAKRWEMAADFAAMLLLGLLFGVLLALQIQS